MSNHTTYTVAGMTCAHCVASVTEEVSEIPGVGNVQVDLASGAVVVTSKTWQNGQTVTWHSGQTGGVHVLLRPGRRTPRRRSLCFPTSPQRPPPISVLTCSPGTADPLHPSFNELRPS